MFHRALTGADRVILTDHFRSTVKAKGFTMSQVASALARPDKVTEVRRYPGQARFCGAGIAVVVDPRADGFVLITAYLDGVVTPLRADQTDYEARNSRRINRR